LAGLSKKQTNKWLLLFLLPSMLGFFIFILTPIIASFGISFTDWDLVNNLHFIGLQNYIELFKDASFWQAFRNTLEFIVGYLPLVTIFGLIAALLVNSKIKCKSLFRGIYFLPVVTSWVAVSLVWKWLFNPSYGLLNYLLSLIHIQGPQWLQDPKTAMFAIVLTSVWKDIGFIMVIYLGGLQSIDLSYYEAAEVDGANGWQQFWKITLPLLRKTTFFVMTISLINSFQVFDQVNIMTGGGPGNATNVIVQSVYNHAFRYFQMGYATSESWILFVVILIVTIIQMKGQNSND
jgi:multiple sugar transport system permease protein